MRRFVWFVDGTIIFCGEDNLKESDEKIQSEMVKLKSWFHVDKLSFNLLKTRFMVIAKKSKDDVLLVIDGVNIEKASEFLRVILNDNSNVI